MNYDGPYCDGRLNVLTGQVEMRMSHWACPPRVTLVSSGYVRLDLMDSLWDVCGLEETMTGIRLTLREYPGDRPNASVDLDAETGELSVRGVITPEADLENAIARR